MPTARRKVTSAYALKKPEIVSGSMAEFGKARYNVDVLRSRPPSRCPSSKAPALQGEKAYTRRRGPAALPRCRDDDPQALHLSLAGVSNPVFIETLELAPNPARKFNGVLCGAPPGRTA